MDEHIGTITGLMDKLPTFNIPGLGSGKIKKDGKRRWKDFVVKGMNID
ncbi:MAG: hypothetical protein LBJ38_01040 [Oscillospiraceae bacterium]|jgi:hypothetical protein|nr:hypothetical protein [Oscillospiraceae bacterium]